MPEASKNVNVDEAATHPLLRIQQLDTETEQLSHRKATLPIRAELAEAQAKQTEHRGRLETVAAQRLEIALRQKRLEQEAATMEARATASDRRLYSGEVRAIRDLQALQDEIAGLKSRQAHLEDQSIEALFEIEELEASEQSLQQQLDATSETVIVLQAELATLEEEIDTELSKVHRSRVKQTGSVEAATLASYERLRQSYGPSTAVEFDPSTGCGCPNHMPTVEVSRIKRCEPGSVQGCSECGRLVLR